MPKSVCAPEKRTRSNYHEVAFCVAQLMRETFTCRVVGRTFDLVVVVIQSDNIGASELDDLACWTADTTADIEYPHVLLDSHDVSKVVLMACDCP